MKKGLVAAVVALTLSLTALAAPVAATASPSDDQLVTAETAVALIEDELQASGTDVVTELDNAIKDYEQMLAGDTLTSDQKQNVIGQMAVMRTIKSDYQYYNPTSTALVPQNC